MNPTQFFNSLVDHFNKNKAVSIICLLLLPIAGAMIYGALKSFWARNKYKKNTVTVFEMIKKADPEKPALTTDSIAKELGIPKDDVISICLEHPEIVDAGKRQRSWKLLSASEAE